MPTLAEIAAAAAALPQNQQKSLVDWLSDRMRTQRSDSAPPHGVLDIAPVSLGKVLRALESDDDVLDEMLENRQ
jgi:hypothetical protein